MSRFFYGSDESEEDEVSYSEEESEVSSSEVEDSEEEVSEESEESEEEEGGKKTGASAFLKDESEEELEESEEERPTVVRSAKDKRISELEGIVRTVENASKIQDWAVISNEFDKMNRLLPKILQTASVPRIYIKTVSDLEDAVNETVSKQKTASKKMNANNAKGFNAIKQRIKKNNKEYADQISKYREAPAEYMEAAEKEEEAPPVVVKKNKVTRVEVSVDEEEEFATVGKGGKTLQYRPETILKHLRGIIESRGKKNVDYNEQLNVLSQLLSVANTPYLRIRVLLVMIPTRFDRSFASAFMPEEQWKLAQQEIEYLLSVLEENRSYIVVENAEEWEDDEKQPTVSPGETFRVPGSIPSLIERLDDELTRSFQQIDPHTPEYIERLGDEQLVYNTIVRAQIYTENIPVENKDASTRVVVLRLRRIYFKPSQIINLSEAALWKYIPANLDCKLTPRGKPTDAEGVVRTLCTYLFENCAGVVRARTMLHLIYFFAIHDRYYQARDMMLMSHLTENISTFDITTQIHFNRTLVQIGLSAFRAGYIYEAQNTLAEICGTGRQKELLAQGFNIQRYSAITPEQERVERQRQMPFHMHVNLELLECIYLTSSMFLEVPLMAQYTSSPEIKRRVISKTFRRMLDYSERQLFNGPPENTRDAVVLSSQLLALGEWQQAVEVLHSIKIWDLLPNPTGIKEMLKQQFKEEGLRTYLFTYAPYCHTLSISSISSMFELPTKKTISIISRMVAHEELAAALDLVNDLVVFRKGTELSRLQSQIVTLADKSSILLESNEKTLEQRTQGTANAFQRDQGQGSNRNRFAGRAGRNTGNIRGFGGPQRRPGGQQFEGGALGRVLKA